MNIEILSPQLADYQKKILESNKRFTVTEACTKSGKAQPIDCIIKTPYGDKKIKDLKENDLIFSSDGTITKVFDIYYQGNLPVYKILFNDKTSTECTLDHLWLISNHRNKNGIRKRKDCKKWPLLMSVKDLLNISSRELRFYNIPLTKSLQYKDKSVLIDPYLLGCLIGDGCMTTPGITFSSSDQFIINELKNKLPDGHTIRYIANSDYKIGIKGNATKYSVAKKTIAYYIRYYNLNCKCQFKRIPIDYKYNSENIRRSILQGIFDTDGYIDDRGQLCIEVTSKGLVDDIQEIIESFGGIVKRRTKENNFYKDKNGNKIKCLPVYQAIIIIKDQQSFLRLPRKIEKCTPKIKPIHRNIKTIEYIGIKETACIKTCHESGLYLTNNCIVTHNTFSHLWWLFKESLEDKYKPGNEFWWIAPVYFQAEIAFNRLKMKVINNHYFKINSSGLFIETPKKTIIRFKSAEKPDNLYGEDVWAAVFDEFTRARVEAWYALRTTLTSTGGKCKMIGNYVGDINWGHVLKEKALEDESEYEYFKITALDAIRNNIISQKEINQAKKDLPTEIFKALYLAEGSMDKSQLILNERILDLFTNIFVTGGQNFISADIAMKNDRFVIVRWNGLIIKDIKVFTGISAKDICIKLQEYEKEWNVPRSNIVYDGDGQGEYLVSYLPGAVPIYNNSRPFFPEYYNLKTNLSYKLADDINNNKIFCEAELTAIVKKQLIEELSMIKSVEMLEGKYKLMGKDDIKKIIGRSPDISDAIVNRMLFVISRKT